MKTILTFLLIPTYLLSNSQNLVPNPGFEEFMGCPLSYNYGNDFYDNWFNIYDSPDYFNECEPEVLNVPNTAFGYQQAIQGQAFSGLATGSYISEIEFNAKEYIQVKLNSPLLSNKMYCGSFFVNLSNDSKYSTDDIGMLFTDTAFSYGTPLPLLNLIPQIYSPSDIPLTDTTFWHEVSGSFIANGGEEFITIGNFKTNSETTYTFMGGASNASYYYIDSVVVMLCEDLNIIDNNYTDLINVYPNPCKDEFHIDLKNPLKIEKVEVIDLCGRILLTEHAPSLKTISIEGHENGTYIIRITIQNNVVSIPLMKLE